MKKEFYEKQPPAGAELRCGECAGLMQTDQEVSDFHKCMICGHELHCEFAYQDPPTVGVNFGFAKPTKWQIAEAKTWLGDGKAWCIVEGADAKLRLYKLY